jgi:putative toxin-antitoxin system antitoxin component (TIGR02293 family)
MDYSGISSILGGKKVLRGEIRSQDDLMDLSGRGLSKEALTHLADYLEMSVRQVARLLPVSERTVQRYARAQRFSPVVSEQIIELTRVAARGSDVFGGRDRFLAWMKAPCPALGNRSPASLLNSRFGADMVMDELGRIEQGIVS